LHIGDIESTDIKGAISVGMRAIRYDGGTWKHEQFSTNDKSQAEVVLNSWTEIANYLL
jgi:FMN phosphatase YigB (HAD superfamily)